MRFYQNLMANQFFKFAPFHSMPSSNAEISERASNEIDSMAKIDFAQPTEIRMWVLLNFTCWHFGQQNFCHLRFGVNSFWQFSQANILFRWEVLFIWY